MLNAHITQPVNDKMDTEKDFDLYAVWVSRYDI